MDYEIVPCQALPGQYTIISKNNMASKQDTRQYVALSFESEHKIKSIYSQLENISFYSFQYINYQCLNKIFTYTMYTMIGLKLVTRPLSNNFGYFLYVSRTICTISILVSFISIIILCSLFRHSCNASSNSAILSPSENLCLCMKNIHIFFPLSYSDICYITV